VAPHSLLAVPVPEADGLVRRLTAEWEPAYDLGSPDDDVHAHVTVLGPFVPLERLPDVDAAVREVLAGVEPFTFVLDEVDRFDGVVVFLRPNPAAPFEELTRRLHERFPEHPPYGGRFAEVVPHLTVGPIRSPEMERALTDAATAVVPLACEATEVRLIWNDDRSFRTVARYALGSA
jgi:2'-5' RNA ligase